MNKLKRILPLASACLLGIFGFSCKEEPENGENMMDGDAGYFVVPSRVECCSDWQYIAPEKPEIYPGMSTDTTVPVIRTAGKNGNIVLEIKGKGFAFKPSGISMGDSYGFYPYWTSIFNVNSEDEDDAAKWKLPVEYSSTLSCGLRVNFRRERVDGEMFYRLEFCVDGESRSSVDEKYEGDEIRILMNGMAIPIYLGFETLIIL